MILRNQSTQLTTYNNLPESQIETIPENQIMKKYMLELNSINLNIQIINKSEADIWKLTGFLREYGREKAANDQILKTLSTMINKSSKNIKELDLDCKWCEQITDKGLDYICRTLRSLSSLRILSLNF